MGGNSSRRLMARPVVAIPQSKAARGRGNGQGVAPHASMALVECRGTGLDKETLGTRGTLETDLRHLRRQETLSRLFPPVSDVSVSFGISIGAGVEELDLLGMGRLDHRAVAGEDPAAHAHTPLREGQRIEAGL